MEEIDKAYKYYKFFKGKTKELEIARDKIAILLDERSKQMGLQAFLFGTINHDFKRYLTTVMAQIEALSRNVDESVKRCLEHIKVSVANALKTINIIDNIEKINIIAIPIHHFLEEYRDNAEYLPLIQESRKNIKITYDIAAAEKVFFDPSYLKRVMNNLISNAIKYSLYGAEIHLSARVVRERIPPIVEIAVSDQGVGIDKDDLSENIFKTRWRSESVEVSSIDGTGVGLSFVKYIVNKCNGEIKAESRPGRANKAGAQFVTTFILSLPVCTPQQIKTAKNLLKRRRRVLVIGERGNDNLYLNRDLQYVVEDLEQGLGIKDFENQKDAAEAIAGISDYGIVVCTGTPENNESILKAAKEAETVAVCLDAENGKVYVVSEENKECVPAASFLMAVSNLIKLD